MSGSMRDAASERHRSPCDIALRPGGWLALTANHTSDTTSLIDVASGKVLAEEPCGRKPAGVACAADGRRAAVSNLWSGTLTLLELQDTTVHAIDEIRVGAMPRGLVFSPDSAKLYVALSGAHEVVQVDWQARQVERRWPAAGEPRRVALTRDGRFLAAGSGRSAQVRCWDTTTGKQLWEQAMYDVFNLHGLTISPDGKEIVTAQSYDRRHTITQHNISEGWAIDNRLGRMLVTPDASVSYWQLALDRRGEAVADPCAVAFSASGEYLAVAAGGTQELVILKNSALYWSPLESGDLMNSDLAIDPSKCRRVPLGGRPIAVQFACDSCQAIVANYLADAVQVVDSKTGAVLRTIALGGPAQPDLARQGEAIFYDARRSHHQWFSCHTCHTDGHTSGRTFDTFNDDSTGNPKLTLSLRGVTKTGPWTWHGWQTDLGKAIEKSMTDTLYGKPPSREDVKAVLAFLETLDYPPNPNRRAGGSLSAAAERGQAIFCGKGHCTRCHQGEHYTSAKNYDVKIEPDGSSYPLWNPPPLRGVFDRGPYLHDGRAATLDDVLRSAHAPEKLGGSALTPDERSDLVEFLKSL
jgi:YVTN family beta-propeller protein